MSESSKIRKKYFCKAVEMFSTTFGLNFQMRKSTQGSIFNGEKLALEIIDTGSP
jgi:hypothetical protein